MYIPPDTDIHILFQSLVNILTMLTVAKQENKVVYIMYNLKINLLHTDQHLASSEFLEMMYSYSSFSLFSKPARIGKTSATLIATFL